MHRPTNSDDPKAIGLAPFDGLLFRELYYSLVYTSGKWPHSTSIPQIGQSVRHLPTDNEWITLEVSLGLPQASGLNQDWRSEGEVGHKMKSTAGWSSNGNGSDESSFSVLPGGFRDGDGVFYYLRESARYWTATKNTKGEPWVRYLQFDQKGVYRNARATDRGLSVRCLKD